MKVAVYKNHPNLREPLNDWFVALGIRNPNAVALPFVVDVDERKVFWINVTGDGEMPTGRRESRWTEFPDGEFHALAWPVVAMACHEDFADFVRVLP